MYFCKSDILLRKLIEIYLKPKSFPTTMFNLKKYYFDGIDKQGNALILYYAELKLFGFKIPYSSFILSLDETTEEISKLRKSIIGLNNSSFSNSNLKISGNWDTQSHSISEVLWQENNSKINWNCIVPKAEFEVEINNQMFSGLGYSEILEMNFVPWKMPISTLKWGRFLSENHTIIWIEWIGKQPLKKVFWNGKLIEDVDIRDNEIHFKNQNTKLLFENPISIKDEKLLQIADSYPFLKIFFKNKFLNSREMKFKSQSTLINPENSENGFSLYETVLWEI